MSTTNGEALSLRDQAREARLEVRLLEAQLRAKRLKEILNPAERVTGGGKLLESTTDVSTIMDWVTAYSDLISRFRTEPNAFQVSTFWDRRYGRNYPLWQTEVELALFRMGSRIMAQSNPYAEGLQRGLRSFIISDKFTYRATSQDDREPDLCRVVQKIIDKNIEHNQWCGGEKGSREHELFDNSIMDGEFFIRHTPREDGLTDTRTVLPEQVRQPGEWDNDVGMFGVHHARGDVEDILGYWVTYTGSPSDGEEVPFKDIVHLPRRRAGRTVLRGCPEFTFQTYNALDAADKLSQAMGYGSTIHARITGVREHQSALQAKTQAMIDALQDYQRPDLVTGALQNFTKFSDGQFIDMPQSMKFVEPPGYKQGAQPFVETLHALLRKAGVKWNAPEWLSTASGADMAAYTASLTAESPFVRSIESEQNSYTAAYRRCVWIWVENCINTLGGTLRVPIKNEDGKVVNFREYTLDEVRRLVTIQVEAKPAQVRNKLEEVQANVQRLQGGWKSPQTIQQEEGLDTERELTNIEEWQQKTGGMGNTLPLPGDKGNPGDGDSDDDSNPPPKKLPTAESRRLRESIQVKPSILLDWVMDVRQKDHFSCGAAAAMAVGKPLGFGPDTLEQWKKALGTDVEESTHPRAIINFFEKAGAVVEAKENMTIADLAGYLRRDMPIIVCCQDYGPWQPEKAKFDYGHYLDVIGMMPGYLICQDSSEDNVIADSGSVQKPGRIIVSEKDWMALWHDKDVDDNQYVHFGIAIGKRRDA